MALAHVQYGQVVDVQPLGDALAGARSHALFKSDDLEVMRLVLRAGQSMPAHAVQGEVTLQAIEGSVEVGGNGAATELRAGQLVHFAGGDLHSVRALEDASLLMTIALKAGRNLRP
jgi:quercetin dioxygenase-like cupin family protein